MHIDVRCMEEGCSEDRARARHKLVCRRHALSTRKHIFTVQVPEPREAGGLPSMEGFRIPRHGPGLPARGGTA